MSGRIKVTKSEIALLGLTAAFLCTLGVLSARDRADRTPGVTVETDGTFSEEMTDQQQEWFDAHWLLQYDLMFGEEYALTR